PVPFAQLAALQVAANTCGTTSSSDPSEWRKFCQAAGIFALTTVMGSAWPIGSDNTIPSTSGGPVGWNPDGGGVAFGPYSAANGDQLWAEFFPCSDSGVGTRVVTLSLCNDCGETAVGVAIEIMFGRTKLVDA